MLILDLDDTIFQTNTISAAVFGPALSVLEEYCYAQRRIDFKEIKEALWTVPIDTVFDQYKIPESVAVKFYNDITRIQDSNLAIQPYADYPILKSIDRPKHLVTTGIRELQFAKIKALQIQEDFNSIHIDDPRIKPRRDKYSIFKTLLDNTQYKPHETWIIGDNPQSEIKAGKLLGMNTIQRLSPSKKVSPYADFTIHSFSEIVHIDNLT